MGALCLFNIMPWGVEGMEGRRDGGMEGRRDGVLKSETLGMGLSKLRIWD